MYTIIHWSTIRPIQTKTCNRPRSDNSGEKIIIIAASVLEVTVKNIMWNALNQTEIIVILCPAYNAVGVGKVQIVAVICRLDIANGSIDETVRQVVTRLKHGPS